MSSFCHWLAVSEEAIHEVIEDQGLADIIVTNANEMVRFVSASDLKDEPVGDPMILKLYASAY